MKFVISTQVLENYGTHTPTALTGSFESKEYYWRFEGGEDYVVEGFDRIQDAVAYVAAKHCISDNYWKEFPVKWRTYTEWLDELNQLSLDYKKSLMEEATNVKYK